MSIIDIRDYIIDNSIYLCFLIIWPSKALSAKCYVVIMIHVRRSSRITFDQHSFWPLAAGQHTTGLGWQMCTSTENQTVTWRFSSYQNLTWNCSVLQLFWHDSGRNNLRCSTESAKCMGEYNLFKPTHVTESSKLQFSNIVPVYLVYLMYTPV
jgi:hypothetical protein